MSRLLKLSGKLLLALIAVGITFVVILLMSPSWQKAVVTDVLEQDSTRKWQVGTVQLTPFSVRISEAFMLQGGAGAELGNLELAGPFWKVPLTSQITVTSGSIDGLLVDVSKVRIGSITSEDWQDFLDRASSDLSFWEERIGILLQKFAASGWDVSLNDVTLDGEVLLPGNRTMELRFTVIEADSRAPEAVQLRTTTAETGRVL